MAAALLDRPIEHQVVGIAEVFDHHPGRILQRGGGAGRWLQCNA
jgi:hypothetical protein